MKSNNVFFDVDTQYDFIFPKGKLPVPSAPSLIPRFKLLTQFAKKNKVKIISSADRHYEKDAELKRNGGPWPDHCMNGEKGQKKLPETVLPNIVHIENRPYPRSAFKKFMSAPQVVVEKQTYTPFHNPNLDKLLKECERVFIYGVASDFCVKATTVGSGKLPHLKRVLVVDAIAPIFEKEELALINTFIKQGVQLTTVDFLTKKWLIDYSEITNQITAFIKKHAGSHSGVVIGVSGGIDSAVVLALSVKALGKKKVHALLMPEKRDDPMQDAKDLVKKLGVSYEIIPIEPILDAYRKSAKLQKDKMVLGNLKARVRMTLLYSYANANSRVVMGTGNRSELLTGYFTRYGDSGVDMLPIADLYKTQVRELARHLKIPEVIIKKAPSAGLWPGQTDEKELGISYNKLDLVLYEHFDREIPFEKIAVKGITKDEIKRVAEWVKTKSFKRELPPICHLKNA